jgi:DNA-binding transcriptional LysR family regulator
VHRSCNDAALLRRWSIDGDGVAYLPWPDVAADVRAGRLHTMLLSTRGEPISLDLLVAHRDQLSEQVRHLHAWLMQCLEGYEMRYPPPW